MSAAVLGLNKIGLQSLTLGKKVNYVLANPTEFLSQFKNDQNIHAEKKICQENDALDFVREPYISCKKLFSPFPFVVSTNNFWFCVRSSLAGQS